MRIKHVIALVLALSLAMLCACSAKRGEEMVMNNVESAPIQAVVRTPVPEWANAAVMYEVNIRQYTREGTFQAFEAHLPRLKELGVDILWLMPIHPISETRRNGTLGSYYAVDDFKAINPEFGTAEDFRSLVNKAHQLGFRVILDWVANHTGWDHDWTANEGWHTVNDSGEIIHPAGTNWLDVADLNYDNQDMQTAMLEAMRYWVAEFDIDGYRADYAGGVPLAFWEQAREELEQIKPVYMLAEDDQQLRLLTRAFNSNYGWGLNNIMNQIAKGRGNAEQVKRYAQRLEQQYPIGMYPLHFTSNHDENSWTGTEYERLGEAVQAMAALTFTLPGMPLIYSGQEVGLDRRLKFFDKDEINWTDHAMQDFYRELTHLKHDNPALWNGEAGGAYRSLEVDNEHILAFERTKDDNTVLVVMNLASERAEQAVISGIKPGDYVTFDGQTRVGLAAQHTVDLDQWSYMIYILAMET